MCGLDLFLSLGNLFEVVLLVVRVFGTTQRSGVDGYRVVAQRVDHRLQGRVAQRRAAVKREHLFVAATPVVLKFAVAPTLLELRLTSVLGLRVVEVPRLVVVHRELLRRIIVLLQVALGGLVGEVVLAVGILALLFFLFLQLVDDFLDDSLDLGVAHLRELEQRVLQGHVASIYSQLIKHVAALLDGLIVGVVFAELWHGLGIARLSQVILVLSKVDATQLELADGLVDAVAGALLSSKDIVLNRMGGVVSRQVQIADGIVNLVEIFLVAVVASHVFERAHLTGNVIALVDRALLDAGVELGAVAGIVAAAGALEGLICQVFLVKFLIELAQQEVLANLLRAFRTLHCLG